MRKYIKNLKIYHIPLAVCLVFSLIQLTLSSSFTLTRWEGGGFGMYSEPNPTYSRIVWVTMKNSNGEFRVRLHPLDKDMAKFVDELDEEKKKHWNKLIEESKKIRNFPKLRAKNEFLFDIANSLLAVNENTRKRMRVGGKSIEVRIDIFELFLDIQSKNIRSKKLFTKSAEI